MLTGIWKHSATIHDFRKINKRGTDGYVLIDKTCPSLSEARLYAAVDTSSLSVGAPTPGLPQ